MHVHQYGKLHDSYWKSTDSSVIDLLVFLINLCSANMQVGFHLKHNLCYINLFDRIGLAVLVYLYWHNISRILYFLVPYILKSFQPSNFISEGRIRREFV